MFGSIGMPELILIFVVALLVFGPKKLPELGKSLGRGLAEFKKASEDLKKTIEDEIEQGKHEAAAVKQHVADVRGSLVAAPIVIPQPQSAILGVGKLERRPVAREQGGKEVVEVRPMCYVTLTIDHRVLDGYQANAFLARWVEEIEGWR